VGLGHATLREEQANGSEITSEHHLIEGCFDGITDREKSNEPQKMVSRPFLMPQRGLLPGEAGKKWSALFMDVNRPVQRGGNSLARTRRPVRRPGWRLQNVPSPHGQETRPRMLPCPYPQGGKRAGGPVVALRSVFLVQVPVQHWQNEQARLRQVSHWSTDLFFLTMADSLTIWLTVLLYFIMTDSLTIWLTALLSGRLPYSTVLWLTAYLWPTALFTLLWPTAIERPPCYARPCRT
jgi:hypothetical protein